MSRQAVCKDYNEGVRTAAEFSCTDEVTRLNKIFEQVRLSVSRKAALKDEQPH